MGTLQHFSGDEIVLSNQQAWQVLVFFFGGNAGLSPAMLTDNDRSFAQAMLLEAIDASEAMGYIESIFRSAMKLKPEVKDILKDLAKQFIKNWFKHATKKALEDPTIYQVIKNTLTLNWRSQWEIRTLTETPVY